jgi:hypothetical protein
MKTIIAVLLPLLACGCVSTRTILVDPNQPVRLAEDAYARVFVRDSSGNWVKSDAPARLPAGAYVVVVPATMPSN